MSTTLTRPPVIPATNGQSQQSKNTRRTAGRNHARIAVGLLVVVVCALGTMSLYSSAGHRITVLAVTRWVAPGEQISADDVAIVSVSPSSQLRTIAASARTRVVGRIAAVGLVPGTLLAPEQVRDGPQVPTGMAITGATLKPGQYPIGLAPGDTVTIIEAPAAATTTATASAKEHGNGQVLDLARSSDASGAVNVSLVVRTDAATAVATAGAAGRLSLVVVGGQ